MYDGNRDLEFANVRPTRKAKLRAPAYLRALSRVGEGPSIKCVTFLTKFDPTLLPVTPYHTYRTTLKYVTLWN